MLLLNYSQVLNQLVNENEDSHQWMTHSWDYGHLLQLAHKDAFEDKSFKWVKAASKTISLIHHSYSHGKRYEHFVSTAQEFGSKVMAPIGFSSTRWVRYSERVFKSFIQNYPTLYETMNWAQADELDLINNVSFVLEVSGLHDVYHELSLLSAKLQIPDIYPWQAEEEVMLSRQKLRNIADSLRSLESYAEYKSLGNDCENPLQSFTKALKNLCPSDPTFQDKPLLLKQHNPGATKTRVASSDPRFAEHNLDMNIKGSREKIASYVDALSNSIASRMERGLSSIAEVNRSIKNLFSMAEISGRERGEVPNESLRFYSNLAKSANQLEADIDFEDLQHEYSLFSEAFHDSIVREYLNTSCLSDRRKMEKGYYTSAICKGSYDALSYSNVTHLLQGATLRLSNEAVIESMGSVVKLHTSQRGRLDSKRLAKECFLSWNGPKCNTNALPLMDRSMEDIFHSSNAADWNLVHADTNASRMDIPHSSRVVSRLNEEHGRIRMRH